MYIYIYIYIYKICLISPERYKNAEVEFLKIRKTEISTPKPSGTFFYKKCT